MLNKILGIMYPNIFANFIQPHSIFLLKNVDTIPTIPTMRDTVTAHFQAKIK